MNAINDQGDRVPAVCTRPDCTAAITRGRVNVCGADPAGDGDSCGMPFCGAHLQGAGQKCERCAAGAAPFPVKAAPDLVDAKLTGEAWLQWRKANPDRVLALAAQRGERFRREQQQAKAGKGAPVGTQ